jgi:2-polyprenyl-3-methyl-5-hydroxy-6-metoxy-1,4-benzoquinol methylase
MHYDPVKKKLGQFFNASTFLRITFYKLLDLLMLRAWHIHKELKHWSNQKTNTSQILDAGSGFGQYTYYMHNLLTQGNITSIDVKEEQVSDCNTFFKKIRAENVLFKVDDLTKYVKENFYDLILCVDVMEHIAEDRLVFKNFAASMRDGGLLLISTPSDQGGSDVKQEGEASFIEEHVREGYNINEIEEKLKAAGFKWVDTKYSYGAPGKISWNLSMKYPLMMLNASKLFFIILPFYYLLTFPFCLILNSIDVNTTHKTGTGLIVKAWK